MILDPRYYLTRDNDKKCEIIKKYISSFTQKMQKKRKVLVTKKKGKCNSKSNNDNSSSLFTTIQRLNKLLKIYDSDYNDKCTFSKNNSNLSDEILKFSQCFNNYYDANYDE